MDNGETFNDSKIMKNLDSKDEVDAIPFPCPPYVRNSVSPSSTTIPTPPTELHATHYNMNHQKRGLAIIFNHEYFNISHLNPRFGTNVDCENFKKTLTDLGFDVSDFHNENHADIDDKLRKIAAMDHSNHDCLIVSVLSHGRLGVLYARDTPYEAETLWSYFTADKCPTLAAKPKMFFIQACQGNKLDGGTVLNGRYCELPVSPLKERTETDDGQPTGTFRIPIHADFLIAYSTIPGFVSWRSRTRGSWFMQALCMELRENGTRYDLLTLLTFVSRRVALDFETDEPDNITKHQQKQIPCITSMLTRLVEFPPKNDVDSESKPTGSS